MAAYSGFTVVVSCGSHKTGKCEQPNIPLSSIESPFAEKVTELRTYGGSFNNVVGTHNNNY